MGQLDGKVAIVTGAASGIGRASAELFVAEGARVVFSDVNEELGRSVVEPLGDAACFMRTDVSQTEEVQALVDHAVAHFGGLDIMYNNAGIASIPAPSFLEDNLSDFRQVMDINVWGVMIGTKLAAQHMAKNGGGVIINTSSSAGEMPGVPLFNYRVSKGAVSHFTRCVALDLAQHNIRVNAVAPGSIKTPMTDFADPTLTPDQQDKVRAAMEPIWAATHPYPLRGEAEHIARGVLYLASDASALVTGVVLPIDGGMTIGDPVNHLNDMMAAAGAALND